MGRTEVVPKARYTIYWERSNEFADQMARAAAVGAWSSVGLLGIHSVISACDALTVHRTGQRWSGQDHAGVVGMVSALQLSDPDKLVRQITRALESKNRVEYEARKFTEREALDVQRCANRVRTWIRAQLPA